MNQQSATGLVREIGRYGSIWPTIFGRLLLLCAATAVVVLLLIAESHLPSERRQQVFDASAVYP